MGAAKGRGRPLRSMTRLSPDQADSGPRCLLLQAREPDDPMGPQERRVFAGFLGIPERELAVFSLVRGRPPEALLDEAELVFIGGSGDYSVVRHWNDDVQHTMERLYERAGPTFGSCWGFQALARALGGEVVQERRYVEVGFRELRLTDAGRRDPVFGGAGDRFPAVIGHEDTVTRLPDGAVCLASTEAVENQAFRFRDRPIYGTQFHPELGREDLIARLANYPRYIALTGYPDLEALRAAIPPLGADDLIRRFIDQFGSRTAPEHSGKDPAP